MINVLYLTDNNYATFAGVSILSLFENNKDFAEINVYIIDDAISNENKNKMQLVAKQYGRNMFFLDMCSGINTLMKMGAPKYRNSYTTYLKLFTFALLPESVHKIFFIDSDSIVLSSLAGLLGYDMQGNPIAAVKDILSRDYMVSLGYDKDDSWYNMGIMLVDVDMWKSMQCEQMLIEQMRKRSAYVAVDQDLLNICLHGRISMLPPIYNATPHHYLFAHKDVMRCFPQSSFYSEIEMEQSRLHPVIHHFERFVGDSPWHRNSLHPYVEEFDHYLDISPWAGYKKKPAGTTSAIFRIERMLYRVLPKKIFIRIYSFGMRRYFSNINSKLCANNVKNIQY